VQKLLEVTAPQLLNSCEWFIHEQLCCVFPPKKVVRNLRINNRKWLISLKINRVSVAKNFQNVYQLMNPLFKNGFKSWKIRGSFLVSAS